MTRPRTTKPAAVPSRSEAEYRTYLGVDPGLDGGLAILGNSDLIDAWACATPTVKDGRKRTLDRDMIVKMLGAFTNRYAAIERVDAAPMHGRRQGTASMFSFGQGYGVWLGILGALSIPVIEVPPRTWKKAILAGTIRDKEAAIAYVKRFHPTTRLRRSERCTTDHTGICDAVCIAEYARQTWRVRDMLAKPGAL